MRNTRISAPEPVFLTGGPRLGPTTTYFWDHTEWSRLYALLEPAGLRSWLLRALSSPYDSAFGFDTRNGGPLGNHYAANDYALFRLVEHYVCITGDLAFLDEQAGPATVLAHLEPPGARLEGQADRGDRRRAGRLRRRPVDAARMRAELRQRGRVLQRRLHGDDPLAAPACCAASGERTRPPAAEAEADTLARAVVGMALPSGRWQIRHPAATESIGHCLDFGLVAAHLHADLSSAQRARGGRVRVEKLLASTWMRALALDDPVAPFSEPA